MILISVLLMYIGAEVLYRLCDVVYEAADYTGFFADIFMMLYTGLIYLARVLIVLTVALFIGLV